MRLLRSYWPQTASKLQVKNCVGVSNFCRVSNKLVGSIHYWPQKNFEVRLWKITKLPFYCRITHLCNYYITTKISCCNDRQILFHDPVDFSVAPTFRPSCRTKTGQQFRQPWPLRVFLKSWNQLTFFLKCQNLEKLVFANEMCFSGNKKSIG